MTNAADESSITLKGERDRLAQQTANADFRWLMADPRGRRFMWALIGECGVFSPVFNTHGGVMNFQEGRRDTGLRLLNRINTLCPQQYAVMAAENQPQQEENDD